MVCWKIPHLVRWFSQKYLLHSQVSFCYYLTSSHDMSIISLFSPSIYMYVYIYIYTHIQTSPLDSAIYFRTSQILYRFFNQSKISVVFFSHRCPVTATPRQRSPSPSPLWSFPRSLAPASSALPAGCSRRSWPGPLVMSAGGPDGKQKQMFKCVYCMWICVYIYICVCVFRYKT